MIIKYLVLGVADLAPVILLIGRVPAISLHPQGLQQQHMHADMLLD